MLLRQKRARRFDSGRPCPYHARAMGNPLRDRRAPSELAAKRQVIEISNKISDFERLAGIVAKDLSALEADKLPRNWRDSLVTGRLAFGYGGTRNNVPVLDGSLGVTVDAVCQRCLEPFRLSFSTEFSVLLCDVGQASGEHDGYDVWELEDDTVRPIDIVDEALVMVMPLSAMHGTTDGCLEVRAATAYGVETVTPFAALKTQLQDRSK